MKIELRKLVTFVKLTLIWGAVVLCVAGAVFFVIAGFVSWGKGQGVFLQNDSTRLSNLGNLGSYLQGTTASQWALAGVFIIFVAFLAQMLQLHYQQRQFERQSFEAAFFQLLALHNSIVDDLYDKDDETKGRGVFRRFHRIIQTNYRNHLSLGRADAEAIAVRAYEDFFDKRPEVLGHYFRNLYHIIKFVDESGILDKRRYTSIVRAQLSSYEHVFLHYNGLSTYGDAKFKPLIEKYALLENMGPGLLMNPTHPTSYSPEAFGEDASQFVFQDKQSHPAK